LPWCEFGIAKTTLDSFDLALDRAYTPSLPPSKWQKVADALGGRFWVIRETGGKPSAGEVPVSLPGHSWEMVLELMAEQASAMNDSELWELVDTLSAKLDGPSHPTMGFPRS
jgi:hypothetical protein